MKTVLDLADWIIKHRRGKAFEGYSIWRILGQLDTCIKNESMLCVTEGANIVGVVCFEKRINTIYVEDVLTTKPGILKKMLQVMLVKFPNYDLQGIRKGKRQLHITNINKLYRRLK